MIYLGLDLGSKTCGIAKSDPFGMIASIYETYRFREDDYDSCLKRIIEIVKLEGAQVIVLGYPKHMNNDVGIRGQISERFKEMLNEALPKVKVILWDERTTSQEVNRIMIAANTRRNNRKQKKDELAAVIILQGYLDCKKEV